MQRDIAVLGRIAAACVSQSTIEVRLADALDELMHVVPAVATLITTPAAAVPEQEVLAGHGYPPQIVAWLTSAATAEDVARAGCLEHRLPVRWRDLPGDPLDLPTVGEHLAPAGYREGATVSLHARDGRHTATLHLSVDDVRHPDDRARDVLAAASVCLGEVCSAVDSTTSSRPAGTTTRTLWLHTDGAVTDDGSRPVRLGAAVVTAARRLADAGGGACVVRDPGGSIRVSVVASSRRWPVLVDLAPAPAMHGLTNRELEVLGRLCDGWSNARIAAALFVSSRTVATHVEHVLAKLGTPTRAGAVSRAVAEGLRILP